MKIYLKQAAPTVLTCLAAVGVVVSVVTSAKASIKAVKLLDQAQAEKKEKLNFSETVKTVLPVYIPTIVISGVTISCVFAANTLNKRHQAAITSAYAMLDKYYKNYRKCLKEVYGDEADTKIKAKMAEEVYIHSYDILGENSVYIPENDRYGEMILFYEEYSKTYFRATYAAVINAQYHFNRNLNLRGYVSVNEFYDFLGIDRIKNGDNVGWNYDKIMEYGYCWFDFNNSFTKFDDGLECYIIEYMYMPEPLEEY